MMRLLLILQITAGINSFSTVEINAKNSGASKLLQLDAWNNPSKHKSPRRTPPNRRTSIKWVIQGVEKCLAEEDVSKHGGKPKYTYRRRIDASLVDALYLMANANSQKDVLDAEKRIKVLLKNPSEFPVEVTERVIRATSVAGLSLSVDLLKLLLRGDNVVALPSSIAYISVLSFLRKIGRIDRLEETLAELANVSRRIQMKQPSQSGIDIVAFNTYLGAICDAAVAGRKYSSCDNESEKLDSNLFNFTNFKDTLDGTTSSEKYLYKGLNLLRGDVARKKFALDGDPDIYSFNSLLTAVAKCSKPGRNLLSISDSCLVTMKKQGIESDTLTYNARIQAAVAANEENRAIQLIDELLASPKLSADRYTINLALMPFVNSGRKGQMLALMRDFYEMNAGKNNRIIVSAFEAFLNTLVQNDEVGLARDVFDAFFLSIPKDRMQLTGIRPNPTTKHFNIMLGGYSKIGGSQKAFELFDIMLDIGVPVDGFTVTSLMTHPGISPEKITSLLLQIESERVILNPAAYRSIIGAYGDAGDAASACWMFVEMGHVCQKRGRGAETWNALLGALARGCIGDKASTALDIYGSLAAKRSAEDLFVEELAGDEFISLVDGMTCLDASFTILDMMRNSNQTSPLLQSPKPNSQTYCLVASSLSGFGTSAPRADRALKLFRDAMNQGGVTPDGRFLNAILRCFGDDIEAALAAWKTDVGPAAASQQRNGNMNLQQAYNGLMHVCGRGMRPDIATRIAYAMNKAGVEPTEVSLNCYKAGKRIAMEGKTDSSKKGLGLTNQYENLLSVECTKYNTRKWDKSKRRAGDKKIRIIL
ncbi:hypothetical protein ACHAWT_005108 [Skeletonema menzelii]